MPRKKVQNGNGQGFAPIDPELAKKRQEESERMKAQEEPNASEIYYSSNREAKVRMLSVYLYKTIFGKTTPETEKEFQEAIKDPESKELLEQVADKTKSWEAAKELMDSPHLQGAVFGDLVEKDVEKSRETFINDQLDRIEFNEKEAAFRKKQGELKDLDKRIDDAVNKATDVRLDNAIRSGLDLQLDHAINKVAQTEAQQLRNGMDHMKQLSEDAGKCYMMIHNVDYFMLGLGSPEFKQMKETVNDVYNYTDEVYAKTSPAIDYRKAAILLEKQAKAISAVNAYLEKKYEDFNEDPFRRNDPARQKREQPRIAAAIETLALLEKSQAELQKVVREGEMDLRDQLMKKLAADDHARKNPNLSEEGYRHSIARSLDMIVNLNGKAWQDEDTARASSIYNRHLKDADHKYTYAEEKKLMDPKMSNLSNAIKAADEQYQKTGKRLTNEDLWKIAQEQYGCTKDVKPLKVMTDSRIKEEKNGLVKDLVSWQVKKKHNLTKLYDDADKRAMQREQKKVQQKQSGKGL